MKEYNVEFKVYVRQVRASSLLNIGICARRASRTTARIWPNAEEEHTKQDPKMSRQKKLHVLINCSDLSLHARVCY